LIVVMIETPAASRRMPLLKSSGVIMTGTFP
jgi:hypothetical protein